MFYLPNAKTHYDQRIFIVFFSFFTQENMGLKERILLDTTACLHLAACVSPFQLRVKTDIWKRFLVFLHLISWMNNNIATVEHKSKQKHCPANFFLRCNNLYNRSPELHKYFLQILSATLPCSISTCALISHLLR